MNSTFIVNFIGKASPATIKQLAAVTHENDGKWLISKVNFIEDQVAGVLKVQLPAINESIVKEAFNANADLIVQFVDSDHIHNAQDTIHHLRLDSNDRAGIVNEVTHVLDRQGISILDMDCHRVFIAGGGGVSSSLFTSKIAVKLPIEVLIDDVVNELETLSEDTRVMIESQRIVLNFYPYSFSNSYLTTKEQLIGCSLFYCSETMNQLLNRPL